MLFYCQALLTGVTKALDVIVSKYFFSVSVFFLDVSLHQRDHDAIILNYNKYLCLNYMELMS